MLTERKLWRTGSQLWAEARRSGERIPVVTSGADVDTGLIYWAAIDAITVDYEKRQTKLHILEAPCDQAGEAAFCAPTAEKKLAIVE